jgi:formylglycine-generating enzyme required for sulfatase activity
VRHIDPKKWIVFWGIGSVLVISGGIVRERLATLLPSEATQAKEQSQVPPGMVYIAGSEFVVGSNDEDADEDARPARRVYVPSFAMDRTEVTNAQYQKFRPSHTFAAGDENLPATNILYVDAEAYAKWAGKRLPTEHEWEKAARGTDGRRYPWGNTWDSKRVTSRPQKIQGRVIPELQKRLEGKCLPGAARVRPVGSKLDGVSPYGCLDMAGNAWEWVQGFYKGNPEQRLLRGGAVGYGERACRTYHSAIEGAGVT